MQTHRNIGHIRGASRHHAIDFIVECALSTCFHKNCLIFLLQGHWCCYIDDIGPPGWNHWKHCNCTAIGSILSSSNIHRFCIARWRWTTMFDAAEYDKNSTVITIILSNNQTTNNIFKIKIRKPYQINQANRQFK